jgi:hypothetical protein
MTHVFALKIWCSVLETSQLQKWYTRIFFQNYSVTLYYWIKLLTHSPSYKLLATEETYPSATHNLHKQSAHLIQ